MYNSETSSISSTSFLDPTPLAELDPEIFNAIEKERVRQRTHIELIASENFTLPAVIEATGSVLTNKYAEGYPAKRYYGGCEHVDVAESLAIERAKTLLVLNMPMFNPTRVARQTPPFILPCSSPMTKF